MKILTIGVLALITSLGSAAAETTSKSAKAVKPEAVKINKSKVRDAFYHKKGYVISPFKPYNILDVKHLKPGNYAYDPTTATVNPKTGKLDFRSGKIFRVPSPKVAKKPAVAE